MTVSRLKSTSPTSRTSEPPSPSNTPTSFDLATITSASVQALRRGSRADQRLATTIATAQTTLRPLLAAGARITIAKSAGNGGESVITVVAKDFDPAKPARVHTHYHGWYSTAAAPLSDEAKVTANTLLQLQRDPQTIIVLPESQSAPTTTNAKQGKTDWSNVQSIARTTDDALLAAGLLPSQLSLKERVISTHSGGGKALGYAMLHTPDGSGLNADVIDLQDCAYGVPPGDLSAVDALKRWLGTPSSRRLKSLTYFDAQSGNDQPPDAALKQALGTRYHHTPVLTHLAAVSTTFVRGPLIP